MILQPPPPKKKEGVPTLKSSSSKLSTCQEWEYSYVQKRSYNFAITIEYFSPNSTHTHYTYNILKLNLLVHTHLRITPHGVNFVKTHQHWRVLSSPWILCKQSVVLGCSNEPIMNSTDSLHCPCNPMCSCTSSELLLTTDFTSPVR